METSYDRIDKEELETYYRSHSVGEVAEHFGISKTQLRRVLGYFGITPNVSQKSHEKLDSVIKRLNIEQFESDFYVMPQNDLAVKYNLSKSQVRDIRNKFKFDERLQRLDDYNINKSELEEYYNSHSATDTVKHFNISCNAMLRKLLDKYGINHKGNNSEPFENLVNRVDRQELENYYLNHTLKETSEHFNTHNLRKLLLYYNIDFKTKTHESAGSVLDRINTEEFKFDFNNMMREELQQKYNLSYTMYRNVVREFELGTKPHLFTNTSSGEQEVLEFIKSILPEGTLILYHDDTVLDGKELDIYIPDKKVAIEFNGDYWHSDLFKPKKYHFNKSVLAESYGIRLIHIFEHEWNDDCVNGKIKTLLKNALQLSDIKIYARNCEVRKISNKEASFLNETVHLQGHRNAQVTYGLFYNNELVQLMSFSKTKYNKNLKTDNSWEIIRGCPGSNHNVIGGVSKLFKHFIDDYSPDVVFSYCDFNKFNGVSYERLGMTFDGFTGPDMKYLMPGKKVVNRNPKNYRYNNDNCIAKIYGSGSKKYIWRRSTNV